MIFILYIRVERTKERKMGISSFQLNIFAKNAQKVAIERQQMAIQAERDIYTAQKSKIMSNDSEWYKDKNIKLLEAREENLDAQIKTLDTQLKDITSNLEALEKGRDEDLKKGIPSLAS